MLFESVARLDEVYCVVAVYVDWICAVESGIGADCRAANSYGGKLNGLAFGIDNLTENFYLRRRCQAYVGEN